jgi:ubiquinone/menaquinone biosynthesis C-methylase UbiE
MTTCEICNNSTQNKSYVAREMMFGYRDEFEYFECSECGCLQIKEIPKNISKYYPKNYGSFGKLDRWLVSKDNFLKSFLKRERTKYHLGQKSFVGRLVALVSEVPETPIFSGWDWVYSFKKVNLTLDSEILDVGCGSGGLLYYLRKEGFSSLTGIDLFIENDIFSQEVKIFKKEIAVLEQEFDFIMLHHSFEHMPQPLSVFKQLYRILKPNRYIVIRIPVASSFAWKKYGVNWVQLDPPRHFFLHTIKSIQILAGKVGFQVVDVVFDSTDFQFWASEQYLKDIPLTDISSYMLNPNKSIFSEEDIKLFKTQASELNKKSSGDQACFYLYKP